MTALVIGAGGFLGGAVLTAATTSGREVRAHLGPGDPPLTDEAGGIRTGLADLRDPAAHAVLAELANGVDVVVHLAGLASAASSFDDAAAHIATHVGGTGTVLDVCREAGVRRLVYVSSAEVYGRPSLSPVSEREAIAPRSPYGAAKVGAEALIAAECRARGLEAVVLRPFSIYGPRARRGTVLATIIDQALAGGDVLLNDLRPVRDYCYVADVAAAIWCAADTRTPAAGEPLVCNIGSGIGTSVAGLASEVLAATGTGGHVAAGGGSDRPAAADILELVADVTAARRCIGWQPTTPLAEGLARTIAAWPRGAA